MLLSFHRNVKESGFFKLVYTLAILGSIFGLFYSRAVLSISQITLACCWLLEAGYSEKIKLLLDRKWPLLWAGLFFIHAIGLLYSTDLDFGLRDLRVKLPLLLYPIVFGSIPMPKWISLKKVLLFFIYTAFTCVLFLLSWKIMESVETNDSRGISFLFSHIRLSLLLSLAVFLALYYGTKEVGRNRVILFGTGISIALFMFYFAFFTGIVLIAVLFPFYLRWLYKVEEKRGFKFKGVVLFSFMFYFLSIAYLTMVTMDYYHFQNERVQLENLPKTINGNPYSQLHEYSNNYLKENGNYILQNICYKELQKEWNERSNVEFDIYDSSKRSIEQVLFRYMTSRGLNKDSAGMAQLSDEEIRAIESGVTNCHQLNQPQVYVRIHQTLWEVDNYFSGSDYNGHSVSMRLAYWKAGLDIFLQSLLTGVGTGDVQLAFDQYYEEIESILHEEWRLRAHNQYLSMGIAFGLIGFLYFITVLIIPAFKYKTDFPYFIFISIALLSMLTEDTLETQLGVSFFAFFNSFLFFFRNRDGL